MTAPMTEAQRQALAGAGESPPVVIDPDTNTPYVLVRADEYARLRAIADGVARRAGWDDPALDDYERYRR